MTEAWADARDAVAAARRAGHSVVDGWTLPDEPWDLSHARITCVGGVSTRDELAAALLAAVRGAGVVVEGLVASRLLGRLVEDLARVGPVEYRNLLSPHPFGRLDEEQRSLLGLIAVGFSLGEAAQQLHISRRTADRRLATARARLGVRSNAAAVALAGRTRTDQPGRASPSAAGSA